MTAARPAVGRPRALSVTARTLSVAALAAAVVARLVTDGLHAGPLATAGPWIAVHIALVALLAGYARHGRREAEANTLLLALHRVARTLPASLDLHEVLPSAMGALRGLVDADDVAVILAGDGGGGWLVTGDDGAGAPRLIERRDLPAPVRVATERDVPLHVDDLHGPVGPGLARHARSGLYAPLLVRGAVIGVLVVEHRSPHRYGRRDVDLVAGFVEPLALAVGNARSFSRLRAEAADEERARIARDLHDGVGQSLTYVALELDRVARAAAPGDVRRDLERLGQDVRGAVGDVRDILADLRAEARDDDLVATLEAFLQRVRHRTGLTVTWACDTEERLPPHQEREMWRIAREAVTNAERHAAATSVAVTWRCADGGALLEVADDGCGVGREAGRVDSYGIVGMRERAAAIGATLDIAPAPSRGTVVRCSLGGGVAARS